MNVARVLRARGIKVTPQRRAVYSVLTKLQHCSVEEVVVAVQTNNPDITVATVYNVLDCFAESGLISRLSTTKGKMYYDITSSEHHHVIADNDKIEDYKDVQLTKLITEYLNKNPIQGYDIDKISLQIYAKKIIDTNN